nr:hypothetical protein [Verrucomicrobiota bacterium]
LARNMGISENTVLARARRDKWTRQVNEAKMVTQGQHSNALSPMHSAAATIQQRAVRHVERIAGMTEKVLPHLEAMEPAEILEGIHEIEKYDRVARRNYGLADGQQTGGSLSVQILTNQAAIAVNA